MFPLEYLFLIWITVTFKISINTVLKNLQKSARTKTAKRRHFRDKKSESQFPQDRLVVNFDRSLLSSWLPLCVQCKEWAQGVVQVCQTSENARHCFLKASPKILPMFKNNIARITQVYCLVMWTILLWRCSQRTLSVSYSLPSLPDLWNLPWRWTPHLPYTELYHPRHYSKNY